MKPLLVGAGVGALTGLVTGKDPLMSAGIGALSGGMFGGAQGFGSGFGFDLGSNVAANTASTGIANAGTALGQGGMNTAVGQGLMGMTPTAIPQVGSGLLNTVPDLMTNSTGTAVDSLYMPDLMTNSTGITPDPYTGAKTMSANLTQEPAVLDQILDSKPAEFLGEFMPSNEDLGAIALNQGINALTPEQQQQIRHQQAMLMRGQTGNLLGQGGMNQPFGNYISRA